MRKILFTAFMISLAAGKGFASDTLSCKLLEVGNWAFYGTQNPQVNISLHNNRKVSDGFNVKCEIRDFLGNSLYDISQSGSVAPLDSSLMTFAFKALAPGFYSANIYNEDRFLRKINVAKEPEQISGVMEEYLSSKGAVKDFMYMANTVALGRRDIKPQYAIARNSNMSGKEKNVYNFSMVSLMDERVTGYIAFPKGKKGLPLIITLVPMEERSANPLADFTAPATSAEMVVYLKQRGKDEQIVKNLLTDMLLAIDYAFLRPEIDVKSIYVQGKGYGAACAMVASAMEDRIAGTFMESPQVDMLTGMYTMESIASHIKAPLLLGTGLQRDAYSLQEIFSIYNRIEAPKEYFVVPDSSELPRQRWKYIRDIFILRMHK